VWFGSEDGKLYAVSPEGSLVWSYATGGPVPSSPAIGPRGEVVVGSRGRQGVPVSVKRLMR
jgi:outer membrane protein assembly factor BamB